MAAEADWSWPLRQIGRRQIGRRQIGRRQIGRRQIGRRQIGRRQLLPSVTAFWWAAVFFILLHQTRPFLEILYIYE